MNVELHVGVDAAEDLEVALGREHDLGATSGILVAGVEVEGVRLDVGVMNDTGIIVGDDQRLALFDRHATGLELLVLLRDHDLAGSRHGEIDAAKERGADDEQADAAEQAHGDFPSSCGDPIA